MIVFIFNSYKIFDKANLNIILIIDKHSIHFTIIHCTTITNIISSKFIFMYSYIYVFHSETFYN